MPRLPHESGIFRVRPEPKRYFCKTPSGLEVEVVAIGHSVVAGYTDRSLTSALQKEAATAVRTVAKEKNLILPPKSVVSSVVENARRYGRGKHMLVVTA